jgi:hypothetical protein
MVLDLHVQLKLDMDKFSIYISFLNKNILYLNVIHVIYNHVKKNTHSSFKY